MGKFKILAVLAVFVILAIYVNFNQISLFAQTKFNQYFTYSVCDKPVNYKIGTVDPGFGISKTRFLADTKTAAKIWEQAQGKELFAYDASDKTLLTINLIYDQRTSLNNQINNMEGQVKQKKQILQSDINSHRKQVADFNKRLDDFETRVDTLNQQIDNWNQKGGVPAEEYEKLITAQAGLKKEQDLLQTEANSLNQLAQTLNLSTENYNLEVGKLNTTVSDFNKALGQKPEEGLYDPASNTISIYFTNNYNELIHTLAHEFGHALGIKHNSNAKSIMYPFSTQTTALSADDLNSLKTVCSIRYLNIPYLVKLTPKFIFYK